MTRGGDGWNGPFYASLGLVIIYPGTLLLPSAPESGPGELALSLLAIGLALDLFLLFDVFFAEKHYVVWVLKNGASIALAWMSLWAGWQVMVVVALARKRRPTGAQVLHADDR